jgi:hypothetical protein
VAEKDQNRTEGGERRTGVVRHAPTCAYWLDQYPWECTCGLTAPLPAWGGDKP